MTWHNTDNIDGFKAYHELIIDIILSADYSLSHQFVIN